MTIPRSIPAEVRTALRCIDAIAAHPRTPERLAAIEEIGARIGRELEQELHEAVLFDHYREVRAA